VRGEAPGFLIRGSGSTLRKEQTIESTLGGIMGGTLLLLSPLMITQALNQSIDTQQDAVPSVCVI